MAVAKSKHGGRRPGAGRRPRGALPGRNVTVRISPEDEAEIVAGLADGETLSDAMREGALMLIRAR